MERGADAGRQARVAGAERSMVLVSNDRECLKEVKEKHAPAEDGIEVSMPTSILQD